MAIREVQRFGHNHNLSIRNMQHAVSLAVSLLCTVPRAGQAYAHVTFFVFVSFGPRGVFWAVVLGLVLGLIENPGFGGDFSSSPPPDNRPKKNIRQPNNEEANNAPSRCLPNNEETNNTNTEVIK